MKRIIADIYPLSPMQEGMLYHYLASPRSEMYFEQTCVEVQGELDLSRLEAAWNRLVERNETLRTIFRWEGLERPMQIVLTPAARPAPFHLLEETGIDPGERVLCLEKIKALDRRKGFDLNRGPLVRVTVCRFPEKVYAVIFSYHHIILDGWSTGILWKEFFATYHSLGTAEPASGELKMKYRDYIQFLETWDMEAGTRFWRAYLQDFRTPVYFPSDGNGSTIIERAGEEQFVLTPEEGERLNDRAGQYRVTPNAILLSAWGILLQRYTGREDAVFGATTSGRPSQLPGIQNCMGLFINTLPVRVRQVAHLPVRAVWSGMMEENLARHPHEYLSLAEIKAQSELPAQAPFFDSILVFENYPIDETLQAMDLGVQFLSMTAHEMTNFHLTLTAVHGSTMTVKLNYNTALYHPSMVKRLLQNLRNLLTGMIGEPEKQVRELELLSAEESTLLESWGNGPVRLLPAGKCIHHLFAGQARRHPEAVAVRTEEGCIGYGGLDLLSDRLAAVLRRRGVDRGGRVGIMMNRSVAMIAGLLGILKAGAAYLPIDPAYPAERIRYMLTDSGTGLLLTEQALAGEIPSAYEGGTLTVEEALREEERGDRVDPENHSLPSDAAYVIYTSGSTGRPKGIEIEHQSVINCLQSFQETLALCEGQRFLGLTTVCFDISVLEIFLPLTSGLQLVLAGHAMQRDPRRLGQWIREEAVDAVQMTPSSMQMLIQTGETAAFPPQILLGGEPLPPNLLQWLQANTQSRILNVYGPTETTIWSMVQDVTAAAAVTLGQPIANTRIYILDEGLRPVPIGVTGEIYIGGAGLARGYLNRPELTAERFLPDPFQPGGRMYRTGDLGRWSADGSVEYQGRTDHQVKIRGYRIESGEIEHVLAACPGVRQCVVTVRQDAAGDAYLAAYLVPHEREGEEPGLNPDELKQRLREVLPDYMIPSVYILLKQMPLTPNGKLDRQALPAPGTEQTASAVYVPPRNDTEAAIARIWAEVLGRERVGVDDNFFELGGHSLKTTRILSRIQKGLGKQISLETFFRNPTVAGLAKAVLGEERREYPVITALPKQPHYPASHSQKRLWVLDQLERDLTAYNMPSAYLLWGDLRADVLRKAFAGVVERHEILRTGLKLVNTELVQFVADSLPLALPYSDLRSLFGETETPDRHAIYELVDREAQTPFALDRPGFIRFRLYRLRDELHLVLVTMHHIISDEWSFNILIAEAARLYEAECRNQPNPLPPLTIQYRDFAVWQNQYLDSPEMLRQEAFWLDHLQGELPLLNLPTDYPRPAVRSFAGDTVGFQLDDNLVRLMEEMARMRGVTLYMLCLAAYYILLYGYTGQTDCIVGTPVAGRRHEELEPLIGFFVNTLPLRMRCRADQSWTDFLQRVKEMTVHAFDAQDYPFDLLATRLGVRRDPGRSAVFDTLFNMLNLQGAGGEQRTFEGTRILHVGGLRFEQVKRAAATSKLDLALSVKVTDAAIAGEFEYCTALFKRATVREFSAHYRQILHSVTANPDQTIGAICAGLSGTKLRILSHLTAIDEEEEGDFNF